MRFRDRLLPELVRLAHMLIDTGRYDALASVAGWMSALQTDRWGQLPDDERIFWLGKLGAAIEGRPGDRKLLAIEGRIIGMIYAEQRRLRELI